LEVGAFFRPVIVLSRFKTAYKGIVITEMEKGVRKKPGPKATGKGELIGVRLQPDDLARLDGWRGKQEDLPSRPEAIRRLLAKALRREK
jgi:hypothetical protein